MARTAPRVGGEGVDATLVDTLALLVSEVVTNSVVHAGTPCTLTFVRRGDRLRVEVRDESDDLPEESDPPVLAEGGRGVGLVSTLSDASGAQRCESGGKTCWFELAVPEARDEVRGHNSKKGRMAQ